LNRIVASFCIRWIDFVGDFAKKVFCAMKRSLSSDVWIRRALAVAVIIGVVAIALGRDTTLLTKSSFVNTAKVGERLISAFHPEKPAVLPASAAESQTVLADEGPLPDLGAVSRAQLIQTSNDKERFMPEETAWLNSAPLNSASLRGKVVLVDFWTYSCINSLRNLPYVESWAAKFKDAGLVVIGVHTPEFSFEKEPANVETAVRDLKVSYPVAIDSNYRIWNAFNNGYWPADYFIDGKGRIRHHHFGEGEYGESERVIQELLKENGATRLSGSTVRLSPQGVEAAPSNDQQSPETYIGYRRADHFASPERVVQDSPTTYSPPARPALNQWGLSGSWNVGAESAVLQTAPGKIVYRFHSRDLHLVLGPAKNGKPVRFKVKLDRTAPSDDHGADSAPDGTGEVREPRLYQLIRQKGQVKDRTFEIDVLDPGVQAFVFTFG
jgi:thiol-disulfide isomerase/thioredoxin